MGILLLYPKRVFIFYPQLGSKLIGPVHLKVSLITAKIQFLGLASVTVKCFCIAE